MRFEVDEMKKKLFAILLTLAMIVAFAACGAKSFDGASYNSSAASAPSAAETGGYWDGAAADVTTDAAERNTTAASPIPTDVKMIYRASLELESTEFGKAEQDIATLVEQVGGYFENRSVRDYSSGYHYAEYTVRVPAEKFHGFLNQIGDLCHVTYKTDSAENITERYYDTESRLRTAQIKLERLQSLLEKAENMEDIITIESAISDTEYEIESFSGELRHYDALVDYATISMSLREVQVLTEVENEPPTFGERVSSAFRRGLADFGEFMQDLVEWLAYSWLTLLVIVAIVVVVVKLIRRSRAKRAVMGAPAAKKSGKLFGRKNKNAPAETAEEHSEE